MRALRTKSTALLGLTILALGPALSSDCGRGARSGLAARPLIGVKIYEAAPPYEPLFEAWRELGVNTVFVSETLLRKADFRARARANAMPVFLIFPVFQDPEAIKTRPDLAAITASGAPARDEWVEFVCPAREDYLEGKIEQLKAAVTAGDPDVVSLDFIRYFVFWEKVAPDRPPESLPQTCFCPTCLAGFSKEMGVEIPAALASTAAKAAWILKTHAGEWTEWKCRTIARAVERLARAAREAKPSIKVNLHAVPWRRDDFGGAIRAVAGQDLPRLAPYLDLISPMCYHHMVRRPPGWIHEVVADVASRSGAPVLASTQVSEAYVDEPLGPGEFQAAAAEALKAPSIGLVLWSWDALAKSPEKQALLRRLTH
jgi:hypothetical protein